MGFQIARVKHGVTGDCSSPPNLTLNLDSNGYILRSSRQANQNIFPLHRSPMTWTDSSDLKTLRLRLVALLSLYDLLPSTFDKAAFLDFNSPPPLDTTAIDRDTTLHALMAIAQHLNSREIQRHFSTGTSHIYPCPTGKPLSPQRLNEFSCCLSSIINQPKYGLNFTTQVDTYDLPKRSTNVMSA